MHLNRILTMTAAVAALMTGVAQAQTMTPPAADPAGTMNSAATTDTSADATTSTSVTTPMASTGMSADTSATLTTTTVTNGPVADTPENRALYKPLSRAGNRTAAKGN